MQRWLLAFTLVISFCPLVWAQEPVLVPRQEFPLPTPLEVIVKYRSPAKAQSLSGRQDAFYRLGFLRHTVPVGTSPRQLAKDLAKHSEVAWAQPNYWRRTQAVKVCPNDIYYRPDRNQRQYQQWYLPKINANFAWSLARGTDSLLVAIVDTGVDLDHPDLKTRLVQGVSIVNQQDYTPPAHGRDDNGHGTHVAGIIGAQTDNTLGVAACAWQGKIMPIKVLSNKGEGTDADIAAGILWAADAGAKVINLSLGGEAVEPEVPQVLQDAVDYAYVRGCLVIAASGNSGDNTVHYPAALNHVLAVAATDPWDRRAGYSTYGPAVDLSAPGGAGEADFSKDTGILSTYWTQNSFISDFMSGPEAGEYAVTAGTSMAAAVVSGSAAVIWSWQMSLTVDQVENLLKSTAVDIGDPGPDEKTGTGRIDLLAALGNPPATLPEMTTYNYPNPFRPDKHSRTQIVFLLDQPRTIELRIYDVSRDLVWTRTLSDQQAVSGKNTIAWDGRNGAGELVANGVYYYRLTAASGPASPVKTIAVLR